jgi:FXSXX-COOH protein
VSVDASTSDGTTDWQSALLDVSGMSLPELAAATAGDDSALAHCLRELAAAEDQDEPIAGFNSAL